jgi:D-erythro-7,8-dihydroneopterin triphosphate epimerase
MSTAADISERAALDRILIRELLVRCILGVNDEERREKQDVVINLALAADLRPSGEHDRLEENDLDYRAIKKRVVSAVEQSSYGLLEALAERVASVCLESPSVREVQVTVDKPGALRFARSVAVEITRARS